MNRLRRCLAALAVAATLGLAAAPVNKIQFTDTKLKNGLRVIISEDHSAPVLAVAVNYNVGSRDERKGRTGFAHLFEHMMFKGSANVGAGEHPQLVFCQRRFDERHDQQRPDAVLRDPAGQSARPRRSSSRPIACDRSTSRKRISTTSATRCRKNGASASTTSPTARTFEVRDELAYENFAYEHSVIGSMADLSAATVDDVSAFFKTYYAPNNAVLSIVGDVDTKVDARESTEVLRVDSIAAAAAGGRYDRAATNRGAPDDD